jgi:hypothetical protein
MNVTDVAFVLTTSLSSLLENLHELQLLKTLVPIQHPGLWLEQLATTLDIPTEMTKQTKDSLLLSSGVLRHWHICLRKSKKHICAIQKGVLRNLR